MTTVSLFDTPLIRSVFGPVTATPAGRGLSPALAFTEGLISSGDSSLFGRSHGSFISGWPYLAPAGTSEGTGLLPPFPTQGIFEIAILTRSF